jgi:hypothetical protein
VLIRVTNRSGCFKMKIVHTVAIRGSGLHSVPYLEGKKEIPIMTTRSSRIFLPLLFTSVLCAQLAGAQTLNQSTPSWWNKYQHMLKNGLTSLCNRSVARCQLLTGFICVCVGLLSSCGSTSTHMPPTVGDFTLTISPEQVSATLGTASPAVSVSVAALNGFTGSVTVTLSGLPAGSTTQPPSPFMIAAGGNQSFGVSIPASSAVGIFSVQAAAVSGSISHTGQVALTVNPVITTADDGTSFVLQTQTSTETTRVGLLQAWGAAITEVSLNGVDYVNNDDPGRQIQTSLWDANANYNTSWGYNPIESGDHDFQGSPVLASTLMPDSIYTKTQPIQWAPENFGGGYGNPVLGDAYIEKWISVVPGYNRVFKVHYKITHFGTDAHAEALQELPVMYVNPNVTNFFYYGGSAPWTSGALSQYTMPYACCAMLPTPEQWGAYVDSSNKGIALYTPGQYPDSKGFNAGSTLQFTPMCPYSWDPGAVLEFDTYILAGPVQESRTAIYALHSQQSGQSALPPMGSLDVPASGDIVTGPLLVQGWAWALSGLSTVDVFVDGNRIASATYGLSRPDIPDAFPGAPSDAGYQYSLDTTTFSNGSHVVIVKATDTAGHVSTFQTRQVTVSN